MDNLQEQETKDKQLEIVKGHSSQLRKHFDTVQIFCTQFKEDDGTIHVNYGFGDFFARYGQVLKWLEGSKNSRENNINNDDDDGITQEDNNIVIKHVSLLSEHFDTVQVFCTRQESTGTSWIEHGTGNYLAIYGHVNKWVIVEEEEFGDNE